MTTVRGQSPLASTCTWHGAGRSRGDTRDPKLVVFRDRANGLRNGEITKAICPEESKPFWTVDSWSSSLNVVFDIQNAVHVLPRGPTPSATRWTRVTQQGLAVR